MPHLHSPNRSTYPQKPRLEKSGGVCTFATAASSPRLRFSPSSAPCSPHTHYTPPSYLLAHSLSPPRTTLSSPSTAQGATPPALRNPLHTPLHTFHLACRQVARAASSRPPPPRQRRLGAAGAPTAPPLVHSHSPPRMLLLPPLRMRLLPPLRLRLWPRLRRRLPVLLAAPSPA